MSDETNATHRSEPQTNPAALTCYVDDVLRGGEAAPEQDEVGDLIARKLDFVVRAARRVAQRQNGAGIDVEVLDLIQEGNIALLQAVEDWVCGRSGLADFHAFISHRVYRALRRCVAGVEQENGKFCSLEEHWDKACGVEVPDDLDPVARLVCQEHRQTTEVVLGSLEPRRRQVVALSFGLVDGQEWTYREIGAVLGVSGSRVGQLMKSATKTLRHPLRSRKLRDFL